MSVLEVRNLKKSFDKDTVVLKGVDFSLEKGETVAIIGSSGSGKTTLLRCLNFLTVPDEGQIVVNGKTLFDDADPNTQKEREIRRKRLHFGLVFQNFNLFPQYTARQNVMLASELLAKEQPDYKTRKKQVHAQIAARAEELLTQVGLKEKMDLYPHQLSGGQQQRVAFARAIVIEPQCILFDEPLSALDALLREEMRTELKELISRLGITAVFVTHDQTEAMSMSDRIAVLNGGAVEQYAVPERIYSAPETQFVARFIGSSNWLDGTHMFRPEKAQLTSREGCDKFTADVISVQFLGGSYQTKLRCGDQTWTIITNDRMQVGTQVSIYINKEDIITVKER